MRRFLLVLLATSVLLAGCATPGDDAGTDDATQTQLTTNEARLLLGDARQDMPDRFGMVATLSKAGAEILKMEGSFDNATGEAYMIIRMDPTFLASADGEGMGGMAEGYEELLAGGFTLYMSQEGSAYVINTTAFVFGPTEEGEDSFLPSAEDSPIGQFLDPTEALGKLDDNTTVTSVRPITYKGRSAIEVQATTMDDDEHALNVTAVLLQNPTRLVRIESDLPVDEEDASDPMSGAHAIVELSYDGDVDIVPTPAVLRSIALLYKSDKTAFGGFGGSEGPTTWTFQNSGGVALADAEAQLKDASTMSGEEGPDALAKAPTLWSMRLSEGTKTQDGVTLTFTDADGDSKVSTGDTLRIETIDEDGIPPQVVLYDTVTGTYVIPSAGLVLTALTLLGAALLVRRK